MTYSGKIKLVYFDLGDTLVQMQPQLQEDAVRRISAANRQILKNQRQVMQAINRLKLACDAEWATRRSEILAVKTEADELAYWPGFYYAVLQRYGLEKPSWQLVELLSERAADASSFICFNDVWPTLTALRDHKGLELGIISNSFPSATKILRDLKLEEWFKYVVFSHETSFAKPAPQIYRRAIDIAHAQPDEALFVDDRPNFVEGAAAIHMRAVLLDRQGQYPKSAGKSDRIRHLGKLNKLVERVPGRKLNWTSRLKARFVLRSQTPTASASMTQMFADAFTIPSYPGREICTWPVQKSG